MGPTSLPRWTTLPVTCEHDLRVLHAPPVDGLDPSGRVTHGPLGAAWVRAWVGGWHTKYEQTPGALNMNTLNMKAWYAYGYKPATLCVCCVFGHDSEKRHVKTNNYMRMYTKQLYCTQRLQDWRNVQ